MLPIRQVLQLPENDGGLPYVRQWILEYARASDIKWYWMLDDDIHGFYRAIKARNNRIDITEALSSAQSLFSERPAIGQAALEYQQFSWSAIKPYAVNSYCDVCVAINSSIPKNIRFRPQTNLKVDRDFTLQILAAGFNTIRLSKIAFAAPKNGSNEGGLFEEYSKVEQEKKDSLVMCQLWGGDICKPKKKSDGRMDVAINWKFFKTK